MRFRLLILSLLEIDETEQVMRIDEPRAILKTPVEVFDGAGQILLLVSGLCVRILEDADLAFLKRNKSSEYGDCGNGKDGQTSSGMLRVVSSWRRRQH